MALIGEMKKLTVGSKTYSITVPTKTSDLTNDGNGTSAFATMADIGGLGGGTITGVKTTAGAHTTIDVSSGNASFNVPTKTSHLTNDSGFVTTDEKLKTTVAFNGTYFPLFGAATSTAETKYYSGNFRYSKTTSIDSLQLGQVSSSSTSKGRLTLCSGPYYTYLDPPLYSTISANQTYTLPASTGTIALTSDIPTKTSDLTNDSGFVTTDEKLSTTLASDGWHCLLLGTASSTASTKYYSTGLKCSISSTSVWLSLGTNSSDGPEGELTLYGKGQKGVDISVPNNLTKNVAVKLPSAEGTLALIEDIPTVPTNISAFTNDAGYLTSYTETDPTVPSWAKASTKPTYTASEVGAQATLVSGTNIKTINGESILGSGDITVGGGGGNFFTVYSKHNGTDLYADPECTQYLMDAYGYDRAALWADLKSADSVRIIEDDPSFESSRLVFVASCIYYDEVEPEIIIYYIRRSQGVKDYYI